MTNDSQKNDMKQSQGSTSHQSVDRQKDSSGQHGNESTPSNNNPGGQTKSDADKK